MRESERRASAQRVADAKELHAGAEWLRHAAAADSHAGIRGRDAVDAVAALLDDVALDLAAVSGQMRRDALRAVRAFMIGPDGPHDPRGNHSALSDGPGH